MNKTALALTGFLLVSGLSFAADPASKPVKAHQSHAGHMIAGIIDSINFASSGQPKSELAVKEENGTVAKFNFSNPSVRDAGGKTVALDKLKAGEKVQVHYSKAKDGVNVAKSITLSQ